MPLAAYSDIPGRPGYEFWLPSELDVRTEVVNHSRVRSYAKFTGQRHSIVHDTGNDKTNANDEFAWLKGGRSGAGAGGYNAITDASRIILCGMFDEIMWHGGTPSGNQTFGTEMAYGRNQKWDNVWDTNAAWHAAICVAFGFDIDEQLHLHQWVYGKYCAAQILNRKMWPEFVNAVKQKAQAIRDHLDGKVPNPAKYAKVVPIRALDEALMAVANPENPALTVAPREVYDRESRVTFFWVGDRVRATKDTRRRQYAAEGAADVGGVIRAGTEFDVNWIFRGGDDQTWYLTPYSTRVLARDTERISDNKAVV